MSRLRRAWWRRRVARCAHRSGSGWSAAELIATAAVVDARRRHAQQITADVPAPRWPLQRSTGRQWVDELEQAAATWPDLDVAVLLVALRFRLQLLAYGTD